MKIAFLYGKGIMFNGSQYKYFKLFGKIHETMWLPCDTDCDYDIAVVPGDGHTEYKFPLAKGKPYILSQHDILSTISKSNKKRHNADAAAIKNAKGIMFTSEEHQITVNPNQPSIVVHLRPSIDDIVYPSSKKLPGKNMVYVGGINNSKGGMYGYRYYLPQFKSIIRRGWNVHLYRARQDDHELKPYKMIGCVIHGRVPMNELYKEISCYTAGFQCYNDVGTNKLSLKYAMTCRPNKLWEYLAAGIPTIGYIGGNGTKLYDGKWGTVLKNLGEINDAKLPVITREMQEEQTIEHDIPRVKEFIEMVMATL